MATATLLQIVQEFCQRTGLVKPLIVAQSQDDTLLQIMSLASEVAEDMVRRRAWTDLNYEATFASVATESQGLLTTLAPNGFRKILNETIFDRTQRLPIFGPVQPPEWQFDKAVVNTGPYASYRIVRGELLISPVPPAGHTYAFEYASDAAVRPAAGAAKQYFTADDDTFLLDKALLQLGLRWRWKEEKGLPYLESYRLYESAIAESAGGDGTKPTLSMSEGNPQIQPGIFVPSGNWSIP